MPYEVKLPDIGEGVAEGEIVRWLVKAGEKVREDQPLVEVMTDKASVEIPSPRTGTIAALMAEEGAVVPVGTVIVTIATDGESAATPAPGARAAAHGSASPAATSAPTATATAPASGAARVQATPAVRELAKKLGVALESVHGSGPDGRITQADVEKAANGVGAAQGEATSAARGGTAAPRGEDEPEERIPLRGLRRIIADHMKRSIQTAAHFTFVAECDMTAIVEHRAKHRARAEQAGVKLTYVAYVLRALIEPLRQFPMLNASLDDARGEIVLKRYYHIGVATHTDEGLTVPIVHHADTLALFALAREIERLAAGARAKKLDLKELQGGTFTVTSTGAKGGVLATPIVHHPQVAILGLHEVKKKPAVVDGAIVARDLCNFSLSLDHRVVDGAVGADFLYALVARLEHPETWLKEADLS